MTNQYDVISCLAESHDSDTSHWFEVTPKPHPLNKQGDGTAESGLICEEGVFPLLDSALLIQASYM